MLGMCEEQQGDLWLENSDWGKVAGAEAREVMGKSPSIIMGMVVTLSDMRNRRVLRNVIWVPSDNCADHSLRGFFCVTVRSGWSKTSPGSCGIEKRNNYCPEDLGFRPVVCRALERFTEREELLCEYSCWPRVRSSGTGCQFGYK